jgi:predicted regulator of Ras-like GTPase activity (Roadblock/LC7/MglB family)
MATATIDKILQELVAQPIGVQGVMLFNHKIQPLVKPIGFEEKVGLKMARMLLNFVNFTTKNLNCSEIEMVTIKGTKGHLVLAYGHPEIFLLLKTSNPLKGLLELEIKHTFKKIKTALQAKESAAVSTPLLVSDNLSRPAASAREALSLQLVAKLPPGSHPGIGGTVIETNPPLLLLVHSSGRVFSLGQCTLKEEQKFYLGRQGKEDNLNLTIDLTELSYAERVSRIHAHIFWDNSRYFIVDNQSTNGTILNAQLLEPWKPYPLSNDDRLELGKNHLVVFTIKLVPI